MGTPRLGEHQVDDDKIKNIVKGLEKLYLGCFREWYKILKSGGTIMIALPTIVGKRGKYSVKKVIDTCENLGYTKVLGPIAYGRPQAIVIRDFYLFKKN